MPVAALAGPIIGGIGSIVGGISGASAARKAADAQAKAAQAAAAASVGAGNNASDYQNQMFNYQRGIQQPFYGAGTSALSELMRRMGLPAGGGVAGPPVNAGMLKDPAASATGAPAANGGRMPTPTYTTPQTVGGNAPAAVPGAQFQVGSEAPGWGPHYSRGTVRVQGPGTTTSDSVPVRLSEGEGVLNAAAMRMPGVTSMVMRLNRMGDGKAPRMGGSHFDVGGVVTPAQTMGITGGPTGGPLGPPTPAPAGAGATGQNLTGGPTPAPATSGLGGSGTAFGGGPTPADGTLPGGAANLNPAGGDGAAAQPWGEDNLLGGFDQQFKAPTVTDDPGFQFRLQQGQQALERSAAARGNLLTGGTAKDLTDYAQGAASQEYGNAYNRAFNQFQDSRNQFYQNQNNVYNRLMGITGVGQNAANTLTAAGTAGANNISGIDLGTANQVGQDLTNAGTARASGYVGSANALNGILPGIGNSLSIYQLLKNQGNQNPTNTPAWLGFPG